MLTRPSITPAREYLNNEAFQNTEYLSRKIISNLDDGLDVTDLITKLKTYQNRDGGFGELVGYRSTVIDTSYALDALISENSSDIASISSAVEFLTLNQTNDGSFANYSSYSSIYTTAAATISLSKAIYNFDVSSSLIQAGNYLIQSQGVNGRWDSDWETGVALIALASIFSDVTQYSVAITSLRQSQLSNGSWGNSVFTTALALRALYLVEKAQLPQNTNTGGITGRIVNANNDLPIYNAEISLRDFPGISTKTSVYGEFQLLNVPSGQYTIDIKLSSFTSTSRLVTIQSGAINSLGVIQLAASPGSGIITGIVTDITNGQPVSGAIVEVVGSAGITITTDINGYYSVTYVPETVVINISAAGYDSTTGIGTVSGGSALIFSPAIYPTGTSTGDQQVTLKGHVVDSQTGLKLDIVHIEVVGTPHNTTSDNAGYFIITDIDADQLNIEISKPGYKAIQYTVVAPLGSTINLGNVYLPQDITDTTITIYGTVTDAQTNEPIQGASILIEGSSIGAISDYAGSYQVAGLTSDQTKLLVTAVGYLTYTSNVLFSGSGSTLINVALFRSSQSGFDVESVTTAESRYPALTSVTINTVLSNSGVVDKNVRLYVKVENSTNTIVEQYPAIQLPLGVDPNVALVSVTAGGTITQEIIWNTARHAPGLYEIIIQAMDGATGQVLSERSTQIEVQTTTRIGGNVEFDPPIIQLTANKPVNINAKVANHGNQVIGPSTVTATVTLRNNGFERQNEIVEVETFAKNQGLNSPRGMDIDSYGNVYTANYASNTVSAISPDGTVREFATGFTSPVDVDIDNHGNVYVLNLNNKYERIGVDGTRASFTTGLSSQQGIVVLGDGRVLIARGNTLYEIGTDGVITPIVEGGLALPQGVAVNSHGHVFIANRGGNNIIKFSNNSLSTFSTGINQPTGIAIDGQDYLYVTSFVDNSLIKIAPDGIKNVVANGLTGPYDVKIAPDGNIVISNQVGNSIMSVTPGGVVTTLVASTLKSPSAAVYDSAGTLYIGNEASIVKILPDGAPIEVTSGVSAPQDMLVADDGGLDVLETGNKLSHISPNGSRTIITSSLNTNSGRFVRAADGDGFLATENTLHRITRVNALGQLSTYMEGYIDIPRSMYTLSNGDALITNGRGYLSKITTSGVLSKVVTGLNNPYGLASDNAGDLYTLEYSRREVLKINAFGNVTVLAQTPFVPGAIAVTLQGNVLITPWAGTKLYKIESGGALTEIATFDYGVYYGLLVDESDNIWAAHYANMRVSKITPSGVKKVYTTLSTNPWALASDKQGGVFVGTYGRVEHILNTDIVSNVVNGGVLLGRYIAGITIDTAGQYLVLDDQGVVNRFNNTSLVNRYGSIFRPQGITYSNDGSLIIVNGNDTVVKVTGQYTLPEIIATGDYQRVLNESAQSLLLVSTNTIRRLDLVTGNTSLVATGFQLIGAMAISPVGRFAVGDQTRNEMSIYESTGVLSDRFIGLYQPWGLLFDETGALLVANRFPNNVSKLRSDGKLIQYSSLTSVQYMYLETSGHILATRAGQVVDIDQNGNALVFHDSLLDSSGLVRGIDGNLIVVSKNLGMLARFESDWSYFKIASGIGFAADIETDTNGVTYISDASKGVVNRLNPDHSLTLVHGNVPLADALSIAPDGRLYVSYNQYLVSSVDSNGNITDFPIGSVFQNLISGFVVGQNGGFYTSHEQTNTISRMVSTRYLPAIQAGQIVFTATKNINSLDLNGVPLPIDFGIWQPTSSGDYVAEIAVEDGLVDGILSNTLHVGPNATGSFILSGTSVLPGDRSVTGYLNIIGADSTSITTIDPQGTTLEAVSGAQGRAIAADSEGNIYAADTSRIVKVNTLGAVSNFITGITVGNGLAVDSQDNIYAISSRNLLKINKQAQVTILLTMGDIIKAVATDYNDNVYIVDAARRLSRVNQNGTYDVIATVGISTPEGLTIDINGDFYILNRDNKIIKISSEGTTTALYFDKATFEYEGVNVTADCSDNLLFAPTILPPFKNQYSEEETIIQLVGDTGEVRKVLDGLSIDPSLGDMDVLFYDRVGKRLLIWTDYYNGKIFAFPIKCGGIDVDAHIVTRSDVDLASTEPAPTNIISNPDGTKEYIWDINDVDIHGENIQLNLYYHGLVENESRDAVKEAFLVFNNSFTVDDYVKVPIPIPAVMATSGIHLTTRLNATVYGPHSNVEIASDIINNNPHAFDGRLEIKIIDSNENLVDVLPPIDIEALVGQGTTTVNSTWNTNSTYTGDYLLATRLVNNLGLQVATTKMPFSIITGDTGQPAVITASVSSDRPNYHAFDIAQISGRIHNISENFVQGAVIAEIVVTGPQASTIYTETEILNALYPSSYQDISKNIILANAQSGGYEISLIVRDMLTSDVISADTSAFVVDNLVLQNITGNVSAMIKRVHSGDSNICRGAITNNNLVNQSGIPIKHQLINLDIAGIQVEITQNRDLVAGETLTTIHSIDTTGIPLGGYACVLQVGYGSGSGWSTIGYDMFNVLPPLNQPPSAIAVAEQMALIGTTVVIDGSASSDPDGDDITYAWQLLEKPSGSIASLLSGNGFSTSLALDRKGVYRIQLIVNDGIVDSEPFITTITVPNTPPVSDAGPDQHINVGDTAVLDGSNSTDVDGDFLSYKWSVINAPQGSTSVLSDSSAVMPTLYVDSHGTYDLQLIVNDGTDDSIPNMVMLTVDNVPPVANAGVDMHVNIGDTVTLDGSSSSDVDGDSITHKWVLIDKPLNSTAILTSSDTVMPSITIDTHGRYTAQLIVHDGFDYSEPDTIILDVQNIKPVADAGEDQAVYIGGTTVLDGTGSHDADGDPLDYQWSILSKPEGSISSLSDEMPHMPDIDIDKHGTYVIQLIVHDGYDASLPDTVVLNVLNVRPVAYADADKTQSVGDAVILDGGASHDADNDPLTFKWNLIAVPDGSMVMLSNPQSSTTSFTTDKTGLYIAQLIVNDGFIDSLPDTIVINSIDDGGPVVSNVVAIPNPVQIGIPISLTASVDDSTTDGSDIASTAYSIDGGMYVSMNASDGIFNAVNENVAAIVPAFAQAGIHEICVHGVDIANNTGNNECILIAVYDPDGGFVTGGGWIDSPAGACLLTEFCADASGKANFGFVSKYKKGANIPTGETNFVFKSGDFHFHSESYEWLVVAGTKAKYKGVGAINDFGNYGFMISAIDGNLKSNIDPDRFRIKIWDKNYNDAVVYDNEIGASEDMITAIIGGGSIVIHTQ